MKQIRKPEARKGNAPKRSNAKTAPLPVRAVVIGTAVIAALAFIVFSPALSGQFLGWDDFNYIRDNPLIRKFTTDNILHIFNYRTFVVGNYHPLTVLSYVIEYQLAGLNPFLYHFDNLLLHLLNIVLVARLMWLLTKKQWATLITAALFALHPMRVESVVWAAERKDVLYTFFFLLALIFYVYYLVREKGKTTNYLLSILFFILSILSKGQAVVLPLVLFLVDYWFRKKTDLKSVISKAPYFALSIASGILAIVAQHSSLTEQRLQVHTLGERLVIAAFNITAYLYKLIFPFNLSCFYAYPGESRMGWVYAGAVIAIIVIVAAVFLFRRNRTIVFGALFFLFTVSIVIQILPVGNAIIADRYTYIPYIGLFFIAGVLLDQVITGKPGRRTIVLGLAGVLMVAYSVQGYAYSLTWHDDETLWKNALQHDPTNAIAGNNLGYKYIDMERYQEAIDLLTMAVKNETAFSETYHAYTNLGVALSKIGKNQESIRMYDLALDRQPTYVEGYFNRGLTFTDMARYDSAVADFTVIISRLDTVNAKAYYSRGNAYKAMDKLNEAIADYSNAIRLDPMYPNPHVNRGNIYFRENLLDKALELDPADGATWLNRSVVYFRTQRYPEALENALKAKELKANVHPNYIQDLQKAMKR